MICPNCGSGKIHKSGKIAGNNAQRYVCNECHRWFSENTAGTGEQKDGFPLEKLKQSLRNNPQTISNLSDAFNVAPKVIRQQIEGLKDGKYNIIEEGENVEINTQQFTTTKHLDPQIWQGDELRFGLVSDNHLCNYNSREEVLHLLYDLFESEGIKTVYNCGNWIDGEFRWNKNELNTRGLTKQIEYAVENYPFREGIRTRFIAGDDHEGWYSQREGINIGEYFQLKREQSGKFDLDYLGYAEADVRLSDPDQKNESWMRIMHPGGGTAYALSYTSQKIVESFQGGEKPKILLIGHYHKLGYEYPREVHCIQAATTCDQTLFMRKNKIQAMLGGAIITLRRAKDGIINRCLTDFITLFDRKFYIGNDKYWK